MELEKIPFLYYTATQAREKLGITKDAFNHYVRTGVIKKTIFLGNHGFYEKSMIDEIALSITARLAQAMAAKSSQIHLEQATAEVQEDREQLTRLRFGNHATEHNERIKRILTFNPRGSYYLYDGAFLVGTAIILPLCDEGIHAFKQGALECTLEEYVEPFLPGKPLKCLAAEFGTTPIVPINRRRYYGQVLLSSLSSKLVSLGEQGIEITHLYTSGKSAQDPLLTRAGCIYLGNPRGRRFIYELDILASKLKILQDYIRVVTKKK